MKTADLHFHSTYSDGRHSVAQLGEWLGQAHQDGLGLAVLTDHDGVPGFSEFVEAVSSWCRPVCATEISCEFWDPEQNRQRGLHLLTYGVSAEDDFVKSEFEKFRTTREQRFVAICENLRKAGIPLSLEKIMKSVQGVLGRPHIADALIEAGVVKTREEAFDKYLSDKSPYVAKKYRASLEAIVTEAKKRGWKTSIAHPGQNGFKQKQLEYFRDLGVNGLEIFHPRHTHDDYLFCLAEARRLDFLPTGGSDFHDSRSDLVNGKPRIGRTQYSLDAARRFLGDLIL